MINGTIIKGGIHQDNRGKISFINDFDFSDVKRFYIIQNNTTDIVRAWQGHKSENKYFYVISGSFKICSVKIDNWDNPSEDLFVEKFIISSKESEILLLPGGNANGIKALQENSKLMVFSSNTLEDSSNDEYRFDADMWVNWGEI